MDMMVILSDWKGNKTEMLFSNITIGNSSDKYRLKFDRCRGKGCEALEYHNG